jgi:3-oxoacyl-[acyl-carrier protein] reductase
MTTSNARSSGSRLEGKVCIVTGGARGIGRGICRQFARQGATVFVADIIEDEGKRVAEELAALGGVGFFVRTNVAVKSDVTNLVQRAYDQFGRVDVLVNDAIALAPHLGLENKTKVMFDFVFKVGLFGTLWGMQAVFPIMRAQGEGSIINFDSRANTNGQLHTADYNSTKAALSGLTKSAAAEWAQYGIRCNALAPFAASMGFHKMVEETPELLEAMTLFPLGRIGDPEDDIAPVAVFLASDDSRFVTGQTINVDGGNTLNRDVFFHLAPPERVEQWLALPVNVQA